MKKVGLFLIVFIFISGFLAAQNYPLGDVDHSHATDITDALLIAQYYVRMNPANFDYSLADTDGNEQIDIVDALLIAQYYVGLITQLPGENTSECTGQGKITYNLVRKSNPNQTELEAYALITEAMDTAVEYYTCYTTRDMHITVYYDSGVPTAQANLNGPISFGQKTYMNHITAMHEMGHCFGVGTHWNWAGLLNGNVYTGTNANRVLRELTKDPQAEIHGDRQHFWPYGLNYTSEVKSEEDLIFHCKIVEAIARDIGL